MNLLIVFFAIAVLAMHFPLVHRNKNSLKSLKKDVIHEYLKFFHKGKKEAYLIRNH